MCVQHQKYEIHPIHPLQMSSPRIVSTVGPCALIKPDLEGEGFGAIQVGSIKFEDFEALVGHDALGSCPKKSWVNNLSIFLRREPYFDLHGIHWFSSV